MGEVPPRVGQVGDKLGVSTLTPLWCAGASRMKRGGARHHRSPCLLLTTTPTPTVTPAILLVFLRCTGHLVGPAREPCRRHPKPNRRDGVLWIWRTKS